MPTTVNASALWWCYEKQMLSASLDLCDGNPPVMVDDCWWFELPWYSYDVTLMWRLSLGFRMPSVNITGRMWQSPVDCPHKGRAMQKVYPCHYGIGDVLASACHQWTSQGVCGSHLWIPLTKGQQCRHCVHVIMSLWYWRCPGFRMPSVDITGGMWQLVVSAAKVQGGPA